MNDNDRPLSKLQQYGVSALDNSELLDLVLGQDGHSGHTVMAQYGTLAHIAAAELGELTSIPKIGPARAARLIAMFELFTRLGKERINASPLDSPERIYECYGPQLSHLPQERVVVATLDTRLRHTATTLVSVGSVNECTAHPREVMRPVITRAAYGFVLLHNHPSGDPAPSRADEAITRRIADVAGTMQVRFVDHIIIGRASPGRSPYFSFREAGLFA